MATAPRANVWFLLEYSGRWGNKAFKESDIPELVKEHLDSQMDQISESRLLLIKQPEAKHEGFAFFAALPTSNPPVLYRFQLANYDELLEFDLPALVAQDTRYNAALSEEPVFVNCTNGLRDQCCALHGVVTYQALAEKYPGRIWQSTHHGGHRFATNFLHLPYGLSYGRLRPETGPDVLQAGLDGKIVIDSLRGRTIYEEPVQAAEILLRREIKDTGVNRLHLRGSQDLGEGRWQVEFEGSSEMHEVTVQMKETGRQVRLSCSDEKMGPVVEYSLQEHRIR